MTIDLAPRLRDQLKVVAARRGTTMRQYCLGAIERQLREEPAEYLTADSDPILAELWDNDDDSVYDDL